MNYKNMCYKKKLLCFSIAMVIGATAPAQAALVSTGFVSPSNPATLFSGVGQMNVGFSGVNGTFEVNTSTVANSFTSVTATGLIIGNEGTSGVVRVIGNGVSGSAQINISNGFGLRNSLGGTGVLEIKNGGVINSDTQDVYLGNQGLASTAGTATTLIDGTGSILRSQQGATGPEVWQVAGGRVYVGFDGQSNSTVNVTNGGLLESLSDATAQTPDGSVWIGTGNSAGSTATVNVSGAGSMLRADTYIEVGARDTNTNSTLNISNGGSVEVVNSTANGEMDINTLAGVARVSVNAASLSAENIQVGREVQVVGFTNSGLPVVSADFDSMVLGQQVSDVNGNLIFDRVGNAVLAVNQVFSGFTFLVPSTQDGSNDIFVKGTGALVVENNATVNAVSIDVSTNNPAALPYNGQGSILTVQSGGVVTADVNINNGGTLNGNGGTIVGNVLVDGGVIAPGNSPGVLTIDGDLSFNGGLLEIEIAGIGDGEFDVLNVLGDASFAAGSSISLNFIGGFAPSVDDTFNFLQAGSFASDMTLIDFVILGLEPGFEYDVDFTGAGVFGVIALNNGVSAVPVPAAVWLFGSGLLTMIGFSRRKKSA